MLRVLSLFIALFLATLTLLLSTGLLGSLLSLHLAIAGIAEQKIGLVMAGFYLGMVVGSLICPSIVRRAGHIRAFAVFVALNTGAVLIYPLLMSVPVWCLIRTVSGMAMMGCYMVIESWLNEQTEGRFRGRVLAIYMAVSFLGIGGGQFLLNAGAIDGTDLFLIVGILSVISLIPVALTRSISPTLPDIAPLRLSYLLHQAPMGLTGSLISGMVASAYFSLAPVFAQKVGLSIVLISAFMGITIISGLAMQWPVGKLSDHYDRQRVLGGISLAVCVTAVLVAVCATRSLEMLMLSTAGFGAVAFTLYPVAVAHTNDRVDRQEIIPASTALILFYGAGACLGPVFAALAMRWLGPAGLFVFISAVAGGFGLLVLVYQFYEKPKSEEPFSFVPIPRTSAVITSLHPQAEVDKNPATD